MQSFLSRHTANVKGVLSGWDRIRFRGTIRWLATTQGLGTFLGTLRILLKDFRDWASVLTSQLKEGGQQTAERTGRPLIYLASSRVRKETLAMEIAERDGITEGLICVFTCVEPCHTFSVGPNPKLKRLELRNGPGKCLHQYFYLMHPELGLMHLRMQTWLPFTIHLCMNGRHWLARQLRAAGIGFSQRENCFVDVEDVAVAQSLLDQQLQMDWASLFNGLLDEVQPAFATLFGSQRLDYYWSAEETEWATDVMFDSPESLGAVYPGLLQHAMQHFGSADVMRFLGRPGTTQRIHHRFSGDVVTTLKTRPEGTRIKHALNRNSLKMYDKQMSVLRVETTINDPRDIKVFRPKEGDPQGPKSWQRLRKGVSDLHRRSQVSQQSNSRYLEALSAVDHDEPLCQLVRSICRPTQWKSQRIRALSPFSEEDGRLLESICRGEFRINGFRNRDLLPLLFESKRMSAEERKRHAAKITRRLRLLRGHGLIRKVPHTHRYQLTRKGERITTAILAAKQASSKQLMELAA